ncbi:hypothetical protein MLD38_025764 [Melastoma candidum]|uniref:Uncharacterized protein n=1 Tax=Melastoma candidum TaxID=119954 RepID=A0ACB9P1K5_9MYRT|nr:hypothetical protein MLD38_025764 [Melastoma candidum]
MEVEVEARATLGLPPNSRPTPSQVKEAFKKKVWESHPDLFPPHQKHLAESRFKRISEAYNLLLSAGGAGRGNPGPDVYVRVVRNGYSTGGRGNPAVMRIPFLFIILGTVGLGGFSATRKYRKQKEDYPSHNPFLP